MALPWVRLDTGFPQNPKVLELVSNKQWRAICSYVFALCYSGAQETDGFTPTAALPMIHSTPKEGRILVDGRMWERTEGGFLLPDWGDYQPTREVSEQRREHARKAARARWSKEV